MKRLFLIICSILVLSISYAIGQTPNQTTSEAIRVVMRSPKWKPGVSFPFDEQALEQLVSRFDKHREKLVGVRHFTETTCTCEVCANR